MAAGEDDGGMTDEEIRRAHNVEVELTRVLPILRANGVLVFERTGPGGYRVELEPTNSAPPAGAREETPSASPWRYEPGNEEKGE